MIVPSGSFTKTFFAMIIAFAMEEEFGDIMIQPIGSILDDIPYTWKDVSIGNVLDMASGHYRFSENRRDDTQNSDAYDEASDHLTKLELSIETYDRNARPGTKFVYHTSDAYIAGWALRILYALRMTESKSPIMNFLSYYHSKICHPLNISEMAQHSIRTTWDSYAQPYSSTGMFFTIDDIIKLSRLLNPGSDHRGKVNYNQKVLHLKYLDESLQLDPLNRGLQTPNGDMYHNGLYARHFNLSHCPTIEYVPYLEDGNNAVLLLPNNGTFIRFMDSDDENEDWYDIVSEIGRIHCKKGKTMSPTFSPTQTFSPTVAPLCPITTYDLLQGRGLSNRTEMTYDQLMSSNVSIMMNMSAFEIPEDAAQPKDYFCGTITLNITNSHFELLNEGNFLTNNDKSKFPEFSYSFVQHGSHLISTQIGIQYTSHPIWEIIVGNGRVWYEMNDGPWSRASFPFTLVEKNVDCAHYGIMTFLFQSGGLISNIAYEIAEETCVGFKANYWGIASAVYQEDVLLNFDKDVSELQSSYEKENTNRIPSKQMEELGIKYNGINWSQFGKQKDITMFAYEMDGVSYVGGFETRAGKYPYPGMFC